MSVVTFTLDVEDYTAPGDEPRAVAATRGILDYLAQRKVRGTFFVVGELADALPDLVTDIAGRSRARAARSLPRAAHRDAARSVPKRRCGRARPASRTARAGR